MFNWFNINDEHKQLHLYRTLI